MNSGQYWARPAPGAPYVIPERDRDGHAWDPRWPVFAVSWDDAVAYAEWLAARDGLPWGLLPELWWEKAARGVDGRAFPWGARFDPALCLMNASRPDRGPEAVGSVPTDVSVYGVRDVGGGIRDWCAATSYRGNPEQRPVRGGSWYGNARTSRCADRFGAEHWYVGVTEGFRLGRSAG